MDILKQLEEGDTLKVICDKSGMRTTACCLNVEIISSYE